MTVGEIIGLVLPIAIAVASVISNIITLIKKNKKSTALSILASVPNYVAQAEQIFGKGNGQAKLQWVLTKIQIDAVRANLKISDEEVTEKVEEILETPEKSNKEA